MKKRIIAVFLSAAMVLTCLSACSSKDTPKETSSGAVSKTQEKEKEMKDVTLNEVAHSIFYAPMYVAVEEGYFEEERINLDLVCGFGVNNLVQIIFGFFTKSQFRVSRDSGHSRW